MREFIPWVILIIMMFALWYSSKNEVKTVDNTALYEGKIDSLKKVISNTQLIIDSLDLKLIESSITEDSIINESSKIRADYESKINTLRYLDPTQHLELFTEYTDSIRGK